MINKSKKKIINLNYLLVQQHGRGGPPTIAVPHIHFVEKKNHTQLRM